MGRQQFGGRYISSHPIAGSDKSGLGQIVPNMFRQKNVIILDQHLIDGDKTGLSLVESFWTSIDMKLKYVSHILTCGGAVEHQKTNQCKWASI